MEITLAIMSASAGFVMGLLAFWMIDEHAEKMANLKVWGKA